jgi:hypothetical protein
MWKVEYKTGLPIGRTFTGFSHRGVCYGYEEKIGFKAKGREVLGRDRSFELKEAPAAYMGILRHQNAVLRPQNQHFWEDIPFISA